MTLGFTLPLYAMLAGQTLLAAVLLLPLPLCKPGVLAIRFATTPVGKSVSVTAVLLLMTLMISPVFDLYSLKKQNVAQAATAGVHGAAAVGLGTSVGHERRETEASANLALVLTFINILLGLVLRKLGLTLDQLDTLQQANVVEGSEEAVKVVEEKKAL